MTTNNNNNNNKPSLVLKDTIPSLKARVQEVMQIELLIL